MTSSNSRRRFLAASGGLFAGTALRGVLPLASGVASMNSYANASDYRALVCIYLHGGNDSFNMLVPRDASAYQDYADLRTTLAVERSSLHAVEPLSSNGADYGFHPDLLEISDLFKQGNMAVVANMGSLIVPTSPQQYADRSVPLPRHLNSHNSQTKQWHRLDTSQDASTGWAGRIADHMQGVNGNIDLPMNITFAGRRLLQVGKETRPYPIGRNGPRAMHGLNPRYKNVANQSRIRAHQRTIGLNNSHPMAQEFVDLSARTNTLLGYLTAAWHQPSFNTPLPDVANKSLVDSLRNVATMIDASKTMGMSRQIFMVGLGGFDTHANQNERQSKLFRALSGGMGYFQQLMEELGIADQVTTFTMSEFGRSLGSNGDGSDHGWGGHQLVMGGAVRGGDIYGDMPDIARNNPLIYNRRRAIIPTTSVEQYAATLASWYGVQNSDLANVFPNLNNFDQTNLGFMS